MRDAQFLAKIYPRLVHWYDWFNRTQSGPLPFTYRWRGRVNTPQELNPKTLTSGLDDYPRASHANDQERHLDLRCWMALASNVMAQVAEIVNNGEANAYRTHYEMLRDNKLLDELHWSSKQYADYGLHSDNIKLVRKKPDASKQHQQQQQQQHQQPQMVRSVLTPPTLQFVNSAGYVSLFPLLLELIDADSATLGKVLEQIRSPREMWTNFGLRSLSASAPLYDKRNTEHDPPYWRSAIWININYLTLKALKHYSQVDGPHKTRAAQIYRELRTNIIENMAANYQRTGYIWEQV